MNYNEMTQLLTEARGMMSPELSEKYWSYLNRFDKKNRLAKRNRTATTDSQRHKVYRAESIWSYSLRENGLTPLQGFDNFKETERYFKKVIRSKTYQKLCVEYNGRTEPSLRLKKDVCNSRTKGFAGWDGVIALCPRSGLNEHTVLHELAHMCGNMHHDVGFRVALVKLVSRFMSRAHGQLLRKSFRQQKLKMTLNDNKQPKAPADWLNGYNLMRVARSNKE